MDHLTCANCGTLNPVEARICSACGVNMAEFAAALPRLRELQQGRLAGRHQELEREHSQQAAHETSTRQRYLARLLGVAGVAGVVVLILASLVAIVAGRQVRQQRERRQAELQRLVSCLDDEDYRCARDGSLALLRQQPDLPEAAALLRQARFGLAGQYGRSGQFQAALDELDAILKDNPGDAEALAALDNMYDRYIDYLNGRGHWLKAAGVRLQKEARFPK